MENGEKMVKIMSEEPWYAEEEMIMYHRVIKLPLTSLKEQCSEKYFRNWIFTQSKAISASLIYTNIYIAQNKLQIKGFTFIKIFLYLNNSNSLWLKDYFMPIK